MYKHTHNIISALFNFTFSFIISFHFASMQNARAESERYSKSLLYVRKEKIPQFYRNVYNNPLMNEIERKSRCLI